MKEACGDFSATDEGNQRNRNTFASRAIGIEERKISHLRTMPRCVIQAYAAVKAVMARRDRSPLHGSATLKSKPDPAVEYMREPDLTASIPRPFNIFVAVTEAKRRSGNVMLFRKFSGMQKIRYAAGNVKLRATAEP